MKKDFWMSRCIMPSKSRLKTPSDHRNKRHISGPLVVFAEGLVGFAETARAAHLDYQVPQTKASDGGGGAARLFDFSVQSSLFGS